MQSSSSASVVTSKVKKMKLENMDKIRKTVSNSLKSQSSNYEVIDDAGAPNGVKNNGNDKKGHSEISLSHLYSNSSYDGITRDGPKGTFSVSDAVDTLGFGRFQVVLSIFTGVCWMADSMEMMTLSILPPALHCDFCISNYQQAFLTTVVFVGMMISSPIWGILSDRYGRRSTLWISVGLLFLFGLASAFSTGYYWLLSFRFFVGIAIGCVPQSVTLYSEFLPSLHRAKCLILLNFFWSLGACFEVLLALVVMPTLGWKWLLGLSSIPIFLYFFMCYWLPESARYQAVSGQTDKAMETLQRIAKVNRQPQLTGQLAVDDVNQERGRFRDLVRRDMRLTTFLLWFIWISCAFCYYGVVFLSTAIFEQSGTQSAGILESHEVHPEAAHFSANEEDGLVNGVCNATGKSCQVLTTQDYLGLLWITLAEFPGILLTMFVLDKIGRKKTMAIQFFLFSITIFAFVFKIEGRVLTTVILFVARGLVSAVFQAAYVYTPEVYPTAMRAIGIGTCSSMARIGAMITPYVAQVLSQSSIPLAAACYGFAALIAAVLSMLLPIETMGKAMPD